MRPVDIPEDVWEHVALKVMPRDLAGSQLGDRLQRTLCEAIMAERDRCANAVVTRKLEPPDFYDSDQRLAFFSGAMLVCRDIAAAIRQER